MCYYIYLNIFPPADAKLLKSTFIGFDDKKIDVDMYMFTFQGATVTMSVTKDTCVPVSEHVTYPNVLVDVGYMGMTSGIKNTTVFDIPKPCQQVGLTGIPHEQNVSITKTRVVFRGFFTTFSLNYP